MHILCKWFFPFLIYLLLLEACVVVAGAVGDDDDDDDGSYKMEGLGNKLEDNSPCKEQTPRAQVQTWMAQRLAKMTVAEQPPVQALLLCAER